MASTGSPTILKPGVSSGASRWPFSVDGNAGAELTVGGSPTRGDTALAVLVGPVGPVGPWSV